MANRSSKKSDVHLSMRVSSALVDALDEEAARMADERPGWKASRTDAARVLLHEALEARRARRHERAS